ncbi:MAG: CoB--CoM heterodisulfide reductase iron-sulfur subunit A family protein [Dethiobacter sp.]|nr:MAG: CoB--CoM heterodisulfide reductase iron-sulfur subunit A family protein [Dethiobacter sp.]
MKRIGVFICRCGTNIAASVDIDVVVKAAGEMPGVVYAGDYGYLCSETGQAMIREAIALQQLHGLVVAACSPHLHETTFRRTAASAGMNPYLAEMANIREHCSWVHRDKQEATAKAAALVRTTAARVAHSRELEAGEISVEPCALVIGGGIAGIQAALDIAEAGYQVDLVERMPSIGGRMAQLDKTFPTLDCSSCILTPRMVEAASHPAINLFTFCEVEKVEGFVGNFSVVLRKKARSVDPGKCTACGLCGEICPVKVKSEFEEGLGLRSAIYTPFPQAVPAIPVLDRASCLCFNGSACGLCLKACPAGALDFEQQDELLEQKYGAIVMATGFNLLNMEGFGELAYGRHLDIITSLQLERLLSPSGPTGGRILKPSSKQPPQSIVFVQCAGSRDKSHSARPYCSKICCMYSAKHALLFKEQYPEAWVYLFYTDICTPGKGLEELYLRVEEKYGVLYLRGRVSRVTPGGDMLLVEGIDTLSGHPVKIETDMVVLAPAITARSDAAEVARLLGISTDNHGFFTEAHPKLRPVETRLAGIFLAGACQGPGNIPETVIQAGAAAAKVIGLLSYDLLVGNPYVSFVNESLCSGCLDCKEVCPYGAIMEKTIEGKIHGKNVKRRVAEVNGILCQGCGSCTVACRPGALNLNGFSAEQLLAEVDAICL